MTIRRELALIAVAAAILLWGCGRPASYASAKNTNMTDKQKLHLLTVFADAWNKHDLDTLMACMTEDCIFESSAGPDVCGERYSGQQSVRAAFSEVFATFPDAQWRGARHFVVGDRGVSEWTFTGTRTNGERVEVTGCDLLTFRGEKIAIKNSYRKNRPPLRLSQ